MKLTLAHHHLAIKTPLWQHAGQIDAELTAWAGQQLGQQLSQQLSSLGRGTLGSGTGYT
ncbi:MAG: hypothetical protein HRT35_32825, partial [Algicola sp.]|nr:hypothetical protein [Algicola sp.]